MAELNGGNVATVYRCDRCKTIVDEKINDINVNEGAGDEWELCNQCLSDLRRWVSEPPPVAAS